MDLKMDRVTIAYLLIAIIAMAMIALLVFVYRNTSKSKYKRLMRREFAARSRRHAKLHGE